jgi:hypothetical protein
VRFLCSTLAPAALPVDTIQKEVEMNPKSREQSLSSYIKASVERSVVSEFLGEGY